MQECNNIYAIYVSKHKTLILLSSLLDNKYETFVLTLINDKSSLSYDEVSSTLVNHELRRKDKESSSSTLAKALTTRGHSFKWKGKGDRERSKFKIGNRNLGKKQCVFCKENRH